MPPTAMSEDSVSQYFSALILQVFPDSVKIRANLRDTIDLKDSKLCKNVVGYFQNKRWTEIDFDKLHDIFKEDCSVAFYSLPHEEKLISLPAILRYSVSEKCNIPGFEYVLENVLLGGDVDEIAGVVEDLSREQLAVAFAVLAYASVKQWELPDCQKLKRMRSAVENLQRSE